MLSRPPEQEIQQASQWDAVMTSVQAERSARNAAVEPYRDVADRVSAILFRHDPIGINYEENTDEYDAEAESIVLRLASAPGIDSAETVEQIVQQEFVRWFDQKLAGPRDRYRGIAKEIWDTWLGRSERSPAPNDDT